MNSLKGIRCWIEDNNSEHALSTLKKMFSMKKPEVEKLLSEGHIMLERYKMGYELPISIYIIKN